MKYKAKIILIDLQLVFYKGLIVVKKTVPFGHAVYLLNESVKSCCSCYSLLSYDCLPAHRTRSYNIELISGLNIVPNFEDHEPQQTYCGFIRTNVGDIQNAPYLSEEGFMNLYGAATTRHLTTSNMIATP